MHETITKLIGQKTELNKADYKICITALLGYTPTDLEVNLLFGQEQTLPRSVLKDFVKKSGDSNRDLELEAMEVFTALDQNCKGYITASDVEKVAHEAVPLLSSTRVCECFGEVSEDNILTFINFKKLYLDKL